MNGSAPPLRFLGLVVGGWIGVRLILLYGPALQAVPSPAPVAPAVAPPLASDGGARRADPAPFADPPAPTAPASPPRLALLADRTPAAPARADAGDAIGPRGPPAASITQANARAFPFDPSAIAIDDGGAPGGDGAQPGLVAPPPIPGRRRWSASAWLLARSGEGGALAPAGTLGGSQAGARLLYGLNGGGPHPLALAARIYTPLRRPKGTEAAIGVDWRPTSAPVHLLAERRQAIGREGRSAFSLTLYGGHSLALPHDFRLDSYAQAGVVGARRRDGFVDASAHLSAPAGRFELGGGLWGAAQPGVARIDAGPSAALRLPAGRTTLRLSADWRFRLAGHAKPASGPALTLAGDF